jgi:hypothetical protein
VVPTKPDWQRIMRELHSKLGSYDAILGGLAKQGVYPDEATLSCLKNGHAKSPCWTNGAALLNLHSDICQVSPVK